MGYYAQKSENFVCKLVLPNEENLLLKQSATKIAFFYKEERLTCFYWD